jgi:DNA-binding MarR family transcriptional regulator
MTMRKQALIRKVTELQREAFQILEAQEPSPWIDLNLTKAQLRICFLLWCHGPMTPGKVADVLEVPKANITGIVDRLVAHGLVSRREDSEDRRSYILRLTEEGHEQIGRLRDAWIARMERVLNKVSQEDLEFLCRGLEALLRTMQDTDSAFNAIPLYGKNAEPETEGTTL